MVAKIIKKVKRQKGKKVKKLPQKYFLVFLQPK